jgi:hypothetical protein
LEKVPEDEQPTKQQKAKPVATPGDLIMLPERFNEAWPHLKRLYPDWVIGLTNDERQVRLIGNKL